MMSIECPQCGRVGSLKTAVPAGTQVRCPGCQQKFEVQAESTDWEATSPLIDLDVDPSDDPSPSTVPVAPAVASDFAGINDEFDPSRLAPSAASAHRSPPIPAKPASSLRTAIPPEPWFYRWVDGFAKVLWYVAMTGVVLVTTIIGLLVVLILVQNPDSLTIGVLSIVYAFLAALVGFLPTFLLSALLQLAVDVARNIRATRYGQA